MTTMLRRQARKYCRLAWAMSRIGSRSWLSGSRCAADESSRRTSAATSRKIVSLSSKYV
jgi:hypothetical protein